MEQQEFDVVVVGSGAGALLAAIRAADQGLKALVVEKTALLGGTSAISGGGIWIPDNHDMPKAGLRDSVDAAFRYVKTCARGLASDDRILAYVETAREMAEGIARAIGTDIGVGITGIAGPGGGTKQKPVGLVFIAVSGPRGTMVKENHFSGARTEIKRQTTDTALEMTRAYLEQLKQEQA